MVGEFWGRGSGFEERPRANCSVSGCSETAMSAELGFLLQSSRALVRGVLFSKNLTSALAREIFGLGRNKLNTA